MSRTPVREALNRLMDQGLVEARHNRGFIVKIFTKKEETRQLHPEGKPRMPCRTLGHYNA